MSQFGWFSYRALTHFLKAICPIYSPDMVMLVKSNISFLPRGLQPLDMTGCWVLVYGKRLPHKKLHDPLILWLSEVTWQMNSNASLHPQHSLPSNLAWRGLTSDMLQAVQETGILVRVLRLQHPSFSFLSFLFFQLYFNKKYLEVVISDFTLHLIILKWPREQKCRQKRKTFRQKVIEAKEETFNESVFIHFNT